MEVMLNHNKPNQPLHFSPYGSLFMEEHSHCCGFIVKVSHLWTTYFMNYIPIFLQLLKELPQ